MKNICSNCEAENQITSKYCSICGYTLPLIVNQTAKTEIEQTKETKPKRRLTPQKMASIVIMIISVNVGTYVTKHFFNKTPEKIIAEMVTEQNKTLPMMVSKDIRMEKVNSFPNGTIQFHASFLNAEKDSINLELLKHDMQESLLKTTKADPRLAVFKENNITIAYKYSDKNKNELFTINITPDMY